MILLVLARYFPDWKPPTRVRATGWTKCLCPAHKEDRPSCSVSREFEAVKCLACGFGGTHLRVIIDQEGVSYREAVRIAQGIAQEGGIQIPPSTPRKSGRRVFGVSGSAPGQDRALPPWLRE